MFGPSLRRTMLSGLALFSIAVPAASAANLKFEHVMNIGSEGVREGQFKYVEDFAFTKDGHLLVTDAAHAFVQVFDKTTGKFLSRFGGKGDDDHQLDKPEGIAVDPDGNIFVADYNTGFVKKYDAQYKWLLTFSEYGSGPGQNMKSEFMDIRDGKLYMPDAGNHRVNVFDLTGKPLFDFGGPGTSKGRFNTPEAAKFSSEGKLYVSDLRNNRIQVFEPDGKFLFSFGTTGEGPGELKSPAGVALDKDDNVYVAEIGNNRVQVFDKTGKFLTMWGQKGSGNGEFGNLHGIIVDKSTGVVYVADTANNRVQVFKPSTKAVEMTGAVAR
jgi:DNA-binding beta-propeller fold protein YncE